MFREWRTFGTKLRRPIRGFYARTRIIISIPVYFLIMYVFLILWDIYLWLGSISLLTLEMVTIYGNKARKMHGRNSDDLVYMLSKQIYEMYVYEYEYKLLV